MFLPVGRIHGHIRASLARRPAGPSRQVYFDPRRSHALRAILQPTGIYSSPKFQFIFESLELLGPRPLRAVGLRKSFPVHVDPLEHFLQFGAGELREPFPPGELVTGNGFDYVYYLQHNPDVAAAGVDPFAHFQGVGWREGRDPNALFDVSGYLATYADVAAANVNPLDHYDQFGWHEGRDPSVDFDTTAYLAAYPDVAAAGTNPLTHFLQFGDDEGRSPFSDGVWH